MRVRVQLTWRWRVDNGWWFAHLRFWALLTCWKCSFFAMKKKSHVFLPQHIPHQLSIRRSAHSSKGRVLLDPDRSSAPAPAPVWHSRGTSATLHLGFAFWKKKLRKKYPVKRPQTVMGWIFWKTRLLCERVSTVPGCLESECYRTASARSLC